MGETTLNTTQEGPNSLVQDGEVPKGQKSFTPAKRVSSVQMDEKKEKVSTTIMMRSGIHLTLANILKFIYFKGL